MASMQQAIASAKGQLQNRQPYEALSTLAAYQTSHPDNIEILQVLAESHLEISALPDEPNGESHAESAYNYFKRAADLDSNHGSKGDSYEKYLWLGQLSGGHDAVKWFRIGCDRLRKELSNEHTTEDKKVILKKKLCDALCSSIEIWMTDLCMEPEAESTCESLITESLMVDSNHQESYTTLASIRISQQRNSDARVALQRSWDLYCDSVGADKSDQTLSEDGADEVAQISSLKTLTRCCIETELFPVAEAACKRILDLDEEIAEVWYLSGLVAAQQYAKSGDVSQLKSAYENFQAGLELIESGLEEPEELKEELIKCVTEAERQLLGGAETGLKGEDVGGEEPDDGEWLDILDGEED
ncbi:hypothetical protein V1525DRAFT_392985 [Lipomyces kononenkoae]|uniref:Uncharacterized protein n=1 Tax=Lipomyces kononenkoae TaxID=34357 RepID=A0ACC3TCA0_LIPKO